MNARWTAVLGLVLLAAPSGAQQRDSMWYEDRGPRPQAPAPGDSRLDTALKLTTVLRDGREAGFYDGQFSAVKDRFDDLAAIAIDPDMNHVLRVVAVMALQEAGDGERLRQALEPLLMSPDQEFGLEQEDLRRTGEESDYENFVPQVLAADLSQHVRFSLAKDGQPEAVLAKIKRMEQHIHRLLPELLDPTINSDEPRARLREVLENRMIVFDIGYHYQQFDDYEHATEWFELLCKNLPGHRETMMAHYNLACIEALSGRPDSAMEHLRSAHAVGFTNVAWLLEDGDLTSLRDRPDFAALVARMRNEEAPPAPSEGTPTPPVPSEPAAPPDSLDQMRSTGSGR